MAFQQIQAARLRFLPAARLPRQLRRRIEPAIDDLVAQLAGATGSEELAGARRALESVRAELSRHGGPGEPCILTKEAVFALSEQLEAASRLLARAGWHAASLVPAAVDDRLLALVAELQPVAPA